jgi:hypothetical protein
MDWAPPSGCGDSAAEELVEPEPWERSLLGRLAASSTRPWHVCLERRLEMVPELEEWDERGSGRRLRTAAIAVTVSDRREAPSFSTR